MTNSRETNEEPDNHNRCWILQTQAMDHIETIKTYRAVSTGIWDRHLQSEVVKEVEGYAFRCKICGYISLNHKEVQLHRHLTPTGIEPSQPRGV